MSRTPPRNETARPPLLPARHSPIRPLNFGPVPSSLNVRFREPVTPCMGAGRHVSGGENQIRGMYSLPLLFHHGCSVIGQNTTATLLTNHLRSVHVSPSTRTLRIFRSLHHLLRLLGGRLLGMTLSSLEMKTLTRRNRNHDLMYEISSRLPIPIPAPAALVHAPPQLINLSNARSILSFNISTKLTSLFITSCMKFFVHQLLPKRTPGPLTTRPRFASGLLLFRDSFVESYRIHPHTSLIFG